MKRTIDGLKVWRCSERPAPVRMPEDTLRLLEPVFPADSKERFVVLMLDSRHAPMAAPYVVSVGSLNASLVHPREVFGPALAARAAAIIVAHNHPSGALTPSGDDLELTTRLEKAGDLLGVPVLDHIVVSTGDIHGAQPIESLSIRAYGWPCSSADWR